MTNEELAVLIEKQLQSERPQLDVWNEMLKKYPEIATYAMQYDTPVNKLRRKTNQLKIFSPEKVFNKNALTNSKNVREYATRELKKRALKGIIEK